MEGLTSFLGYLGKKDKLLKDNQETKDFIRFCLPDAPEALEPNNSLSGFIRSVTNNCSPYLTYSPKPQGDNLALFQNGELIWKRCVSTFKYIIQTELVCDLEYILASSWRYTWSLDLSPKIINGTKKTPSSYIKIFDGIKKNGNGRGEIRKLLENSGVWFDKETYGFPTNMAMTPLPQFIRRYYDLGITFDDQGKPVMPSDDEIKTPIMNSIFDIAPVLGLLSVSTPRKNPYIKDKDNSIAASVSIFIKSFDSAPLNTTKVQDGLLSAEQILNMVISVAEKEGESDETINFLKSISPEELVVFNQFVIERLAHGMFLEKALRKTEGNSEFSSYLYYGYIYPLMLDLVSLPLPITRLKILDIIRNEDYINHLIRKAFDIELNKSVTNEMRLIFMAILTSMIREYVRYWRDIVIPVHILVFHYFARKSCLYVSHDDLKGFFSNYLNLYNFYTYNDDGQICINCDNAIPDDANYNERAKAFYDKFNEETAKQARENRLYKNVQKAEEIKRRTAEQMAQAYSELNDTHNTETQKQNELL